MICGTKLKATSLLSLLVLLPSLAWSQQSWQEEKRQLLELIADLDSENERLMFSLMDKDRQLTEVWNELKELKISLEVQKNDNQELMRLWNEEKTYTSGLKESLEAKESELVISWSTAGVSAIAFIISLLAK